MGVAMPETDILSAGTLVTPWSATRMGCMLHHVVDDALCAQAMAPFQEVLS